MLSGMDRIVNKIASRAQNGTVPSDVLVISDNALLSLDLSMALTPRGFVAITHPHSAAQDLEETGTQDYAAVILDIERSDNALVRLMTWITAQDTPVFVVSTLSEDPQLPPVNAWFNKPLSVETIFEQEQL